MIAPNEFEGLIAEVAKLNNLDRETAELVVVAIGDVHALDRETGKVIADLEDGRRLLIEWPDA